MIELMRAGWLLVVASCATASGGPKTSRYVVEAEGTAWDESAASCRKACADVVPPGHAATCQGVSMSPGVADRLGKRRALVCVVREAEPR